MKKDCEIEKVTRREAFGRVAAGIGALSLLKEGAVDAQQRPPASTKKGTVNTVLGAIPTTKLGLCLSHEHICTASAGIWQSWPQLMGGREAFIRDSVELLKKAKDEGLTSFQDVGPIDLGRD